MRPATRVGRPVRATSHLCSLDTVTVGVGPIVRSGACYLDGHGTVGRRPGQGAASEAAVPSAGPRPLEMLAYILCTVPFVLVSLPFLVTWLFPCNSAAAQDRIENEESDWVHVPSSQNVPYQVP